MTQTYQYLLFVWLLFLVLCSSCEKEEIMEEETKIELEEPKENSSDIIAGNILDFNQLPIPSAEISLSINNEIARSTFSDENGDYILDILEFNFEQAVLKIKKEGFRTIYKLVTNDGPRAFLSKMATVPCEVIDLGEPVIEFDGPLTTLSGKAFHYDGAPAQNSEIWISNVDRPDGVITFLSVVVVDEDGSWESIIPKNEELNLVVDLASECNPDVFFRIGPYDQASVMEDISGLDKAQTLSIKASAGTCDGAFNEQAGITYFVNDGSILIANEAFALHTFEACYVTCDVNYVHGFFAYDALTNQYGIVKRKFEERLDFGNVATCTPFTGFYNFSLDGQPLELKSKGLLSRLHKGINQRDEESSFSIGNIIYVEKGGFVVRIHVREPFEAGKTFTNFFNFSIYSKDEALTYGNFEGAFTVDRIEDGYAIGTVDGVIYESANIYPADALPYDNIPIPLSGDFKILVF